MKRFISIDLQWYSIQYFKIVFEREEIVYQHVKLFIDVFLFQSHFMLGHILQQKLGALTESLHINAGENKFFKW